MSEENEIHRGFLRSHNADLILPRYCVGQIQDSAKSGPLTLSYLPVPLAALLAFDQSNPSNQCDRWTSVQGSAMMPGTVS